MSTEHQIIVKDSTMEKQVEKAVSPTHEELDLRALLDIEILSVGGGETVVGLY